MTRTMRVLLAMAMLSAMVATGSAAATSGLTDYIVVLKANNNPANVAAEMARAHNGRVGHVYEHALSGFSIRVPARAVAAIAKNPAVAYVEADQLVSIAAQNIPTGISRIFAPGNGEIGINGTDDFRVDVDVAVLDTGIDLDHPDLNVFASTNCSGGSPFKRSCGSGGNDGHGHGTHVAGTIGAIDNDIGVVGVAPGARLWAVKVLNDSGSGYNSWILAGLDYVVANAGQIEVGNMSLGGGFSQALNDGVAGAVNAGVTMVVAAGNSDTNAGNSSPASEPSAITVSALADFNGLPGGGAAPTCRSDVDDTFADFSNWGSVIDIIAPGVCILSTVPGGGYDTFSGTSMAAPHVAGAAALLASGTSTMSPATIRNTLVNNGNLNWDNSDDGDSIKEPLLDVSDASVFNPALVAGSGGGGGTDDPPTVTLTSPTDGATVSGTVTVAADASDDHGVSQVQFFVDGTSIGLDSDGSNGWSVSWDTTSVGDGSHTVTATATDTIGQTASDSHTVTVANTGGGGEVDLTFSGTSINNGGTWTARVTVTGATSSQVISGTWENATAGGCTADSSGSCSFDRTGIAKRVSSVTWTHTDTLQQITITKP